MESTGPESPQNPELDIEKLHSLPSEQQDLYLLTFSSDLARHVASLDSDGASAHQIYVKKEVFKVLSLSSPAPTRVIRNNLGNALAGVLGKGDRKLLFESVNELLSIINSNKTAKDSAIKHAGVHCLGAVFEAAGDSVISLSPVVCSTLLRVFKAAQNNAGLRAAGFKALGRVPRGVGKSLDETVARDIWKQARTSATSDRALLVQSNACWCLGQLCLHTLYFDNSSDFDKLQTVLWKAIDNPSISLRRAAAACLSGVFVKNFSKVAENVPRGRKLKKTKTQPVDGDDAENAMDRSGSPGPQAPSTSLSFSLQDILQNLTNCYGRATTSNRMRAGVAMTMTNVFRDLDDSVVEENYNTIVLHCFNELQSAPSVFHNRFRVLMTRKFIRTILGDSISRKTLGETAQTNAIKFLVNGILKDYPQPEVKERTEPGKQTIIATLDLLTILMDCLGSATYTVSDICRTAILQVLEHPNYTVQIHAARCLRMFALTCPQQMIPVVTICMNSVNREVRQLTGPRRSPRRCIGYAFGLAAALSTSSLRPLYGSVDVFSRVLEQATAILKSSGGADLRISSTQIQVAWIMIGGLMSLGPSFVKIHLSQFLLMWRNALPKPMSKEHVRQSDGLELSFLTHVRECALGAIRAFVEFNSRLLTLDVCNRLAAMLQNTTEFLNSLPAKKTTEDMDKRLSHALQLQDYDLMVRRRVFQCYTQLLNQSPSESRDSFTQSSILTFAISCFTDPENVSNTSLSSSIATSTGNLDTVWDLGDNSGFGVTSFVNGLHISSIDGESASARSRMETNDSVINHTVRLHQAPENTC